ncbi:MAG: hypothetical protein D6713_02080, partial [Deltaproteobacteria bacterium]
MGCTIDGRGEYFAGLDLGSQSVRAGLFSREGRLLHMVQVPVGTRVDGLSVTQDPDEYWEATCLCLERLLRETKAGREKPLPLGVATQRSSFLFFSREGKALTPLVSWRDTSASLILSRWEGLRGEIYRMTGLPLTPYYSGPKISMYGEGVPEGSLFGPLITFIVYRLTGGALFVVDPGNAQRTLLFDINEGAFSEKLLSLFGMPEGVSLPEVVDTHGFLAKVRVGEGSFSLLSLNGDQQAAALLPLSLFPGSCFINYGTGGFLLAPTDDVPPHPQGFIVTVGEKKGGRTLYLVEGTVNGVGEMISRASRQCGVDPREVENVPSGPIPAVAGAPLGTGAPFWGPPVPFVSEVECGEAGGEEFLAGTVYGTACFLKEMREKMEALLERSFSLAVVTGGLSRFPGFALFVSALLGIPCVRPEVEEMTCMGAALGLLSSRGEMGGKG